MAEKMSIEEQIAHLLRLAENSGATEAERTISRERAEKLMVRHAIDRAMLDGVGEQRKEGIIIGRIKVWGGGGSYSRAQMEGMHAVAVALGLKSYHNDNTRFNFKRDGIKPHYVICFAGFESDVREAEQLINSLLNQGMLALKEWWDNSSEKLVLPRWEGYYARNEFLKYFGLGAGNRIQTERKVVVEETTGSALVLVDREAAVKAWADENLNIGKSKRRGTQSDFGKGAGYAAGQKARTRNDSALGSTKAVRS